jgi:hypothetical protein
MAENNLIKIVSTVDIDNLNSIDNRININKTGKYNHFQMFKININIINNFILNLNDDKLYVLIPLISITNRIDRPYTTLSRKILISKFSNHKLITEFFNNKLMEFHEDIEVDEGELDFYLIFKYKSITLEN